MSNLTASPENVPVFVLCGGRGTRLGLAADGRPKPMIEVGGEPLLIHLIRSYARFGFRRFVLCTGHRHEVIAGYFLNYSAITNDFTIDLASREVAYHQSDRAPDWQVTIAHTGDATMTGARIARAAARHLDAEQHFAVTYGDGLTDADLGAELDFHLSHGRIGTVLSVNPPSQFGEFRLDEGGRPAFSEKPLMGDRWINGGFFFFRRRFLDYLSPDPTCVLEEGPLRRLTADRQLELFRHHGFWSCIDTIRDRDRIDALCASGSRPWLERVCDAAD